jgi:hypothetical protein
MLTRGIGDFVSIGRSATKVFKHWPLLLADYDANSCEVDAIWRKHSGELIDGPRPLKWSVGRCVIRKQLQRMLEEAVGRQKIPIKFNTKATSYFEDGDRAGVVLETGERLTADLVVACDGVHSRSWQIVNGKKHNIVDSGHAVYRSAVPKTHAFKDPAVAERFAAGRPYMQFQLGPRSHALVFYDGATVCWSLHHPVGRNIIFEIPHLTLFLGKCEHVFRILVGNARRQRCRRSIPGSSFGLGSSNYVIDPRHSGKDRQRLAVALSRS